MFVGRSCSRRTFVLWACAIATGGVLVASAVYRLTGDAYTALGHAAAWVAVAGTVAILEARRFAVRRRLLVLVEAYTTRRAAVNRLRKRLRTVERRGASPADVVAIKARYEAAVSAGQRGLDVVDQKGLLFSHLAQLLIGSTAEAHLALGRTEEVGRLVDDV